MELVEGKDLRAVWNRCVQQKKAFPLDVAIYIVKELARGLHYIHSVSGLTLVHRDVSPPNILLSYDGQVKLADFGLALSEIKTGKTAPGIVYGKVSYLSPEQVNANTIDGRSDLFSLAVILWELVTGKRLFAPGTEGPVQDLEQRLTKTSIQSPSTLTTRVSQELDDIIMKGLCVNPKDRYESGEIFRVTLSQWLAEHSPSMDAVLLGRFLTDLFEQEQADELDLYDTLLKQAKETKQKRRQGGDRRISHDRRLLMNQPMDSIEPGMVINERYKIISLIGKGSMGKVYEATHVGIDKPVALKFLNSMNHISSENEDRFRQEAKAASAIGHPNIVDVFDLGHTSQGNLYSVMELLKGKELRCVIDQEGCFDVGRALHVIKQICEGLCASHQAGIVHRDLKPTNVFLIDKEDQKDFVKLLDFGVAKLLNIESEDTMTMTMPGVAVGTFAYMSPQQALGQATDLRMDIYATGMILYEMLTSTLPYDAHNLMKLLSDKATLDPKPLTAHRHDISDDVGTIVEKALARNVDNRYQDMTAMITDIDAAIAECDS